MKEDYTRYLWVNTFSIAFLIFAGWALYLDCPLWTGGAILVSLSKGRVYKIKDDE